MSERRIERLVNPAYSNLPAFLVKEGGLNSGFMIAHCTAAALGERSLCPVLSLASFHLSNVSYRITVLSYITRHMGVWCCWGGKLIYICVAEFSKEKVELGGGKSIGRYPTPWVWVCVLPFPLFCCLFSLDCIISLLMNTRHNYLTHTHAHLTLTHLHLHTHAHTHTHTHTHHCHSFREQSANSSIFGRLDYNISWSGRPCINGRICCKKGSGSCQTCWTSFSNRVVGRLSGIRVSPTKDNNSSAGRSLQARQNGC